MFGIKKFYKHFLIVLWSKRALKYDSIVKMYVGLKDFKHLYATGLAVTSRDKCLEYVEKAVKIK